MRKFLINTLMVMCFGLSAAASAEETWKITSLNWEPYSGATLSNQGNAIQKLREVLKAEGINLIVEFYPWARAKALAETNDYVGFFPAWPEEVEQGFVASNAVDWSEIGVMRNKAQEVSFSTVDELFSKYKVGLVKTYVYPEDITKAMEKYKGKVDEAPDENSLLKKLSTGRHPAAITDPTVMMYLAQQQGTDNVEPVQVLTKKELVVAFRDGEDNKARIALLNKLLEK
ncbi:transporter substrate-binding domain-containing protein [Aliiglaciecola sp. CAU 1673]|uniref:substrate-binding periplasmic protein n=1 Tax=Aliiglaciecola sp. CAU 1673 TaxID=3032595 RepID=UPI0023D9A9DE|nr:transporter substrate-binding domain-containing protein [Aliiglaciecola sp. CAU 1673]MDF2177030.1 transporter substrate-binding domain-containing protein [Aliiglaciecola sp. CAU 1673]